MGYVIKMPKLGLEMEQGTLLEWHLREGDSIEEGETIAEVESEKSIGEIDARENGVLRFIGLEEGTTVPPGTPIGIVADADEDIADLKSEFDITDEQPVEPTESEANAEEPADESSASATNEAEISDSASASVDLKASPRAKRRADELGVDITGVEGSGPQGAITVDDVEAVADTETEREAATEQMKASPRAERRAEELDIDLTEIDGSGPEGAITADDVEDVVEAASQEASPNEETADEVKAERDATISGERYQTTTYVARGKEADTLIETTNMAANAFEFDVDVSDVLLLALSSALNDHPKFNATFEDNTHHLHEHQNIKIVIDDVERERNEFVLSSVDERTFTDIAETSHDRQAPMHDDRSGSYVTFILANGADCKDVQSIVTAPAVAGLVVNHSYRRASPTANGVSFSRYLRVSLAYDSRAIGDRDADAFLESLLEHIEGAPELVLQSYR
ncbi:E3 binding domain-containing protein [Halalkalicoccus ordinarius]|uniref:E3 binding domain-containing protein n=1 Tax=Halalkalicoccus ordinarius TaxID=3116651 RepID=UPI00300F6ACE